MDEMGCVPRNDQRAQWSAGVDQCAQSSAVRGESPYINNSQEVFPVNDNLDNSEFLDRRCGECDISTAEIRQTEVRKHLQRRLMGFVMREMEHASSFIGTFCGPDSHGNLSNGLFT